MKTSTDPRHQHRVKLVQHLFSSSFQNQSDQTISHIWSHRDSIDSTITKIAPEWPIDKLNNIDLAILRLAVYELVVDSKEPYKVIIDEAIELAKEFGGPGSPAFINGALGNLINQIENDTKS